MRRASAVAATVLACAVVLAVRFAAQAADAPNPGLTVRTLDGMAVPDAEVVALEVAPDGGSLYDADVPVVARGGLDGHVAAFTTPSPAPRGFAVRASGRALALLPSGVDRLALAPAKPIAGWLRLADGSAPPAGRVVVVALPPVGSSDPVHRTRPDSGGRFQFDATGTGTWRIEVRRRDGAWQDLGRIEAGHDVPPAVLSTGTTIKGRVLDAEGGPPPAGAVVRLRRAGDAESAKGLLETKAGPSGPFPVVPAALSTPATSTVAETVVGADGRFVFADLPLGVFAATWDGADRLWDGDEPRIQVDSLAPRRLETWWVRRRGAVRGIVRDAKTRTPIAGASVRVVPAPDAGLVPGGLVPAGDVVTGPDGKFRVAGIAPGAGYRLVASAPGKSPEVRGPVTVAGSRDEDTGDLLLFAAWALDLIVTDADGTPIPGATVSTVPALRPSLDPADRVATALARRATTDATGRARLEDLPEGDALVRASKPGYVDAVVVAPEGRPTGGRPLRLDLARTVTLRGRLEAVDGPLPATRVRAVHRATGGEQVTTPLADGSFEIRDLVPAPTDLEVVPAEAGSMLVYVRREGVLPGSGEIVTLPVPSARRVSGEAEDLTVGGGPAVVRLEALRFDAERDDHRAVVAAEVSIRTDASHAPFAFPLVPPGSYALRLVQGRRDSGPVPIDVTASDVAGLELRLPAAGAIEGTVVDVRRRAAAVGARVTLVRLEGSEPAPVPVAARSTTTTGDDGRYRFEDVGAGLWRVDVADRDAPTATTTVRLESGETVTAPSIELTLGGRIEGKVTDERGTPIVGLPIRVFRRPDEEELAGASSGEDGTFRTPPLSKGRYRLVAAGTPTAGGFELEADVVDGEVTKVEPRAFARGRIDGSVRRRGTPVPGIQVEAVEEPSRDRDRVVWRTVTDLFGQFHWDGLSDGTYTLRLVDGAVRSAVAVRLVASDRVSHDLELGEGRISGTVLTVGGKPVRGADVVAWPASAALDADDAAYGRVRTGPDGSFAIPGLPVGLYRLVVTPIGSASRMVPDVFADLAGSERILDVRIGLGARLDLDVRDPRGRGVGGAEIWVESLKGEALHPRPFVTASSGRVVIDGLPDGAARVRVHAKGYGRPRPAAVTLRDGASSSARIELAPAGSVEVLVTAGRDPVARARVTLQREGGGEVLERRRSLHRPADTTGWGITPRTGLVLLDDLEEGTYVVVVSAGRELAESRTTVRVRPGETTKTAIALEPIGR